MKIKCKKIGGYGNHVASIVELIIITDTCELTETITSWKTNLIDESLIEQFKNLIGELEEHNFKVKENTKH